MIVDVGIPEAVELRVYTGTTVTQWFRSFAGANILQSVADGAGQIMLTVTSHGPTTGDKVGVTKRDAANANGAHTFKKAATGVFTKAAEQMSLYGDSGTSASVTSSGKRKKS